MSFSTNSFPSLTSISLSLLPIQQIETYARHNLKCHTYHEQYTSNKQLFEYLYESDHYGKHIINSNFDTFKITTINSIVKHTQPIIQHPYQKTSTQKKIIAKMCDQFYHDIIIRSSQS
ncbi:unnamed protein product, partial [Rotaria sordida]